MKSGTHVQWLALLLVLFTQGPALLAADGLHEPSAFSALVPSPGLPFQEYVEGNTARIRNVLEQDYFAVRDEPFGPHYALEDAVAMRAPYQFLPDPAACNSPAPRMGFLLIHGLTDSPYLLHDVTAGLRSQYPCALLRGLLLPGHGTVPGDTLEMRYEDWIRVTEYGVESFRDEVDALYLVGFSTGTSLSVRYVDAHRSDALIKGLVMLSPAIKARSSIAFLSPYVRWFRDWLSENAEGDSARYESFSMNAGAEFYELTKTLSDDDFAPLQVPVMMAASAVDTTVDTQAALAFFCAKTPVGHRKMLWYLGQSDADPAPSTCDGVIVQAGQSAPHRVINLAHTSLTMSPNNAHYGLDGDYALCLQYSGNADEYAQCRHDNTATVYAESGTGTEGRYEGKLIRRGSFNPHFDALMAHIVSFIESER